MNTTIRNLDESAYRELKARAALSGETIGELVTDAIRCYLAILRRSVHRQPAKLVFNQKAAKALGLIIISRRAASSTPPDGSTR